MVNYAFYGGELLFDGRYQFGTVVWNFACVGFDVDLNFAIIGAPL